MNKTAFLASRDVAAFTDWLAGRYRTLSIRLDIKSSRYVPGGIRAGLTGLDALLPHYRWRTQDSVTGDWNETRACLRRLGDGLKQAIAGGNDADVREACRRILVWGGNRDFTKGAMPFLDGLHAQGRLTGYLETARRDFALDGAVVDPARPQAAKMNSMLTKVHVLAAADGLPIYDSRVAAAIAALVELWRREAGQAGAPLPAALAFPALSAERAVPCLFADAHDPGMLSYAAHAEAATAAGWSGAKIRLGWLIGATLDKAPGLFAGGAMPDRMHAFEASLFMIGYDVACLAGNAPDAGSDERRRAAVARAGRARLRREHAGLPRKTIATLDGDTPNITYAGDVDAGISGVWNKTPFAFDSDFLQALLDDFPAGTKASLGASMTGPVAADTLGAWIDTHYPARPRRLASALAPILVAEGRAERDAGAATIRLRFL